MPWFQTWKKTYLTKRLAPADTTAYLASPPVATSGRMLLVAGNITEWIKYTGVSGNTITGLTRNLSQTADPVTWGTGLDWQAGTQVILVAMHDQIIDKEFPHPVPWFTTVALDALDMSEDYYTGTYPFAFDTTVGQYKYYNGSVWTSFATGTVADATPSVGGKVKVSTADTGNTPVVLNSTDPKYLALAGTSWTPSGSNKYVTQDDVAENTASKVIRRKSDSNITVPTTPTASTDAASKEFVEDQVWAITGSSPEQVIPTKVSASTGYATNMQIGSSTDGSIMVVTAWHFSSTLELWRLAKDSGSGQYIVTHNVTLSVTNITSRAGIAITSSYVYVTLNDNGTRVMYRFDLADLANSTSMTISGTGLGNSPYAGFSDGTNIYFYNNTSDQFNKYTVSGTTATFDSTITYASAWTLANGWSCCDGTNVYTLAWANGSNTIRKYALAGWSSTATLTRFFYTNAYNNPWFLGLAMNKTGIISVGLGHTLESNTTVVASALKLNAVSL